MTDQDKGNANDGANRHLEESVASGRITEAEADVIRLFFASSPSGNWPATDLQRRMQGSGG